MQAEAGAFVGFFPEHGALLAINSLPLDASTVRLWKCKQDWAPCWQPGLPAGAEKVISAVVRVIQAD
jgi:hypothetical protein